METHLRESPPRFDVRGFELEADVIRVLANPKRLMIVSLLGSGPVTVSVMADRLGLSLQNVSQHLRVMKDRNIVRAHRDGREVQYTLTSPVFSECCRLVRRALVAEAQARPAHFAWTVESPLEPEERPAVGTTRGRPPFLVTR